MPNQTLTCQDCQNEFVWTNGEQEFYKKNNLSKPSLCPICRAKKQAKERQFAKYQKKVS